MAIIRETTRENPVLNDVPAVDGAPVMVAAQARRRSKREAAPQTTTQRLQSVIKTVRDQLRKDAGLSGDADRLPQLTWLLFLKAIDDFDFSHEEEQGAAYAPVIEPPYRWRDWAAVEDKTSQMSGDELLAFVNGDLLPYLSRLSGVTESDVRTIVGRIFQGTTNRVRSGYILREVVDKLSTINFNVSDDVHTLSVFYETMLREMRDAAGDSGEFYTPRPVVRFIVDRLAPKLGETVLDPACGTGGFLVETYERLKSDVRSPEQMANLETSLIGIEKKPLPYLLGVMNLMLHGIESPNVLEENALSTSIRQIRNADRVDCIATNPPFGGDEERGILNNFPQGLRTTETAVLYFQFVMAKLKRPGGRCGIVLPNGFLFGTGITSEIKKSLLSRFNLHTVIRLPEGVFSPYTDIPTNLLFFDAVSTDDINDVTSDIWYYELPPPEGRRKYSKTKPLRYDDFADCMVWWADRQENEYAWKVSANEVIANGYNLDIRNPNTATRLLSASPDEMLRDIIGRERRVVEILEGIARLVSGDRQ
jgi:type I restriction enzyme M protein